MNFNMKLAILFSAFCASALSFSFKLNKLGLAKTTNKLRMSSDEYTIAILGDLHLDPRFMDDHIGI